LKHRELLDAAHIIPDNMPEGKSTIDNGLPLCKLHHAAYDSLMIGVTPDYVMHVREDILEEEDGPVLQHGLKELHKTKIILPNSRSYSPSRDALEWRYSRFSGLALPSHNQTGIPKLFPESCGVWSRAFASCHHIWTYFPIQPFSELIFGNIQIILRLQSKPELRRVSKETCQPQGCIRSYTAFAKHDLIDTPCIHADVNGKAVLAQVHRFDEFFQ
jgi:hypothetical protein